MTIFGLGYLGEDGAFIYDKSVRLVHNDSGVILVEVNVRSTPNMIVNIKYL